MDFNDGQDMEETMESESEDSSNSEVDEQVVVLLFMTPEQRLAVQAFFGHNNWDYIEKNEVPELEYDDADLGLDPGFVIQQNPHADECAHCLCRPCITDPSNQQMWWEVEIQAPHERNSSIRKGIYKRSWTMLFHRLVWKDQRYLLKKKTVLQECNNRQLVWGGGRYHKRDIMPDCVLKLVRYWYPNPAILDYMGHRWG